MYTPDGYISDPPDAVCPHCGKKQKSCSYVNSLSRAWARNACSKKQNKQDKKYSIKPPYKYKKVDL